MSVRPGAVVAVALAVALLLLVGAGVRARPEVSTGDTAATAAPGWMGGTPAGGFAEAPGAGVQPVRTVVVQPGDTVWELARAAVPAGIALEDYVADVVVRNGIDPQRLAPGTTLHLP